MKYIVLVSLAFLAACQSTGGKPVDISKVNISNPYVIGFYVTYSELCSTYNGSGTDKLVLRSLTEKFEGNRSFKKGYDKERGLFIYDLVTGLNYCDKANAIVNAAHNNEPGKSSAVLPNPAPSSPQKQLYQLELSWENLLEAKKTYPIYIQNVGRKGYLTSVSLIGGKDCKGVFNYTAKGAGDWTISCKDGTKANGVMTDDSSGKGSFGSGKDSGGNKITFKTYQIAFAK